MRRTGGGSRPLRNLAQGGGVKAALAELIHGGRQDARARLVGFGCNTGLV